MKNILFIVLLTFSLSSNAEEISAFVRINYDHQSLSITRLGENEVIPSVPANQEIKKQLANLTSGAEARVTGHITYVKTSDLRELRPVFVVESVKPISLKELGVTSVTSYDYVPQFNQTVTLERPTFFVTTEVASAITMTTSLLLMEELTSGPGDPEGRRDMRKALFFSAGTMATLLFIYEQIQGKSKP